MHRKIIIFSILAVCAAVYFAVPNIAFKIGLNQFRGKNFDTAYKYYGFAKNFQPQNKEFCYNYVLALANRRPNYSVQKEMFELAHNQNEDSATQLAKVNINQWRNKLLKKYGHNYIEQTPYDNRVLRWDKSSFPLRVHINYPENENLPPYYRAEITKAFYQWQKSTGFLTFNFVNNKSDAQIVVKINPLPKNIHSGASDKYVIAYTEPEIRNDVLKKMIITLYDKDAKGSYFSDKELYNTVLHEIGHALGIMGHSYSTDDLMYMSNENTYSIYTRYRSSFQYISQKDLNTINLLYNFYPDITNINKNQIDKEKMIYAPIILGSSEEISDKKLAEAKSYVQKAPNMPGGYIDLAIAYANLGKNKKSLESLEKALTLAATDDDKYIIYYNIAVVNLNTNKLSEAMKYAKLAQNIKNDDNISDLLSNIEHSVGTKKKPFKDGFISE